MPTTNEVPSWFVYIVHCADGTLYTGITNNVQRRIHAHNTGKGAKYTKSRRPVRLLYVEQQDTKGEALSREYKIKQFPREKKIELIAACKRVRK